MIFWIWTRWEHDTEKKTQHDEKTQKVEFQQDEHFESSEFHIMGQGYYKRCCFVFRTYKNMKSVSYHPKAY